MASIRISQLNQMNQVTPDDFVPVVDSGSLTTLHTPISVLGTFFDLSGSVRSASWASRSVDAYGTASYSNKLKTTEYFRFPLTLNVGNAIDVCRTGGWGFLIHLGVYGLHCACSKTYIVESQYTSPGVNPPYTSAPGHLTPYTGWFTVRPIVAAHEYPYSDGVYSDFDLEVSQSNINQMIFRVRTSTMFFPDSTPTASMWFVGLDPELCFVQGISNTEVPSSNDLPSWGSAFVTQQGNYRFTVSGSMTVTQPITASLLFGTASWAQSSSVSISSSYAKTASYCQLAQSASHATSASNCYGTASYALGVFPPVGIVPIGTILDYAGPTSSFSDPNWLICTGSTMLIADYPELFAVIGTTWGGNGVTTFDLPDLRKRTTIGFRGSMSSTSFISHSVGRVGGGESLNYHTHWPGIVITRGNDDGVGLLAGSIALRIGDTPKIYLGGNKMPYGAWCGECSSGQPRGYWGNVAISFNESNRTTFISSYGISKTSTDWVFGNDWDNEVDWYDAAKFKRYDLNPPYAVVMKIIRAR